MWAVARRNRDARWTARLDRTRRVGRSEAMAMLDEYEGRRRARGPGARTWTLVLGVALVALCVVAARSDLRRCVRASGGALVALTFLGATAAIAAVCRSARRGPRRFDGASPALREFYAAGGGDPLVRDHYPRDGGPCAMPSTKKKPK